MNQDNNIVYNTILGDRKLQEEEKSDKLNQEIKIVTSKPTFKFIVS